MEATLLLDKRIFQGSHATTPAASTIHPLETTLLTQPTPIAIILQPNA